LPAAPPRAPFRLLSALPHAAALDATVTVLSPSDAAGPLVARRPRRKDEPRAALREIGPRTASPDSL